MYKPLDSGKPSNIQRYLFQDRDFLCLFPLSETAFMVGFVGIAHSLTSLLVSIFDMSIGNTHDIGLSALICTYQAMLCLGYTSGCVGSGLFNRKLVNVMCGFMFLDVVLTAGLDIATASSTKHVLSSSHFELWILYRISATLVTVYALLKVSKQVTLMKLFEESNSSSPLQILSTKQLENETGPEVA
jgi:hypothetical protein